MNFDKTRSEFQEKVLMTFNEKDFQEIKEYAKDLIKQDFNKTIEEYHIFDVEFPSAIVEDYIQVELQENIEKMLTENKGYLEKIMQNVIQEELRKKFS